MQTHKAIAAGLLSGLLLSLAASSQQPAQPSDPRRAAAPAGSVSDIPVIPGPARPADDATMSNPYEGDQEAIRVGQRYYEWYNCSGCHAPKGGGGMGPPLSDDDWIYGDDPVSIFKSIWEGRPEGMPAWAGKIPPEEVWKLVAYLQDLPGEQPAFAPQEQ